MATPVTDNGTSAKAAWWIVGILTMLLSGVAGKTAISDAANREAISDLQRQDNRNTRRLERIEDKLDELRKLVESR